MYADSDPSGNDALYWVFNALILALGIGLNRLGVKVRRRKVQGGLVMRTHPAANDHPAP